MWLYLSLGLAAILVTWGIVALVNRFAPGAQYRQQQDPGEDAAPAAAQVRAWLRSLPERWADWRDRPRGTGPRGTDTQKPERPDAAPAADTAPRTPLPPPPAELPPAAEGAPAGAPSAGGAQSDLLYAINALAAEASHGDIKAVRRVFATFAAATGELGSALMRLGQRLAEPDKDYDPVIWEPAMSAGAQCRTAAIQLGEGDAMLVSLLHTTVQELADSPRRAPHSSQMNGGA
jgi:hypothetical protein